MEDKIKNFDRSIEQAMNETSVTPPFGMWNRISAELDVPAPAPSTWTASTLIPKAALMGLVTVAVLESTLLVAYLFHNSNNKNSATENTITRQQPVQARNVITIPEVKQEQIAALPEKEATIALRKKIKLAPVSIAKPVDMNAEGVNQSQPELTNIAANSEVAVPQQTPAQENGIGVATEAYYFPPVDNNNKPEPKVAEKDAAPTVVKTDDNAIESDKKVTLPTEQKVKFRPPHKHKFRYGHLNRIKGSN